MLRTVMPPTRHRVIVSESIGIFFGDLIGPFSRFHRVGGGVAKKSFVNFVGELVGILILPVIENGFTTFLPGHEKSHVHKVGFHAGDVFFVAIELGHHVDDIGFVDLIEKLDHETNALGMIGFGKNLAKKARNILCVDEGILFAQSFQSNRTRGRGLRWSGILPRGRGSLLGFCCGKTGAFFLTRLISPGPLNQLTADEAHDQKERTPKRRYLHLIIAIRPLF
jgi:hypothetical protein